jgi:hypothetical protein
MQGVSIHINLLQMAMMRTVLLLFPLPSKLLMVCPADMFIIICWKSQQKFLQKIMS